jgi:shikimate kinase
MEYVIFENYNNDSLKKIFINELKGEGITGDHGVQHLKRLANIILDKGNKIKVNFSKCKYKNVYTIMISCHIDSVLIKLGRKYNFPRGFPILWIPGSLIKLFGFYPKFDNDDRQTFDQESEFDNVNNIQFFKKWSGFLGQVCIFKIEDKLCWSCCSKNSADFNSEYVKTCKRLFEPFINITNLEILYSENYHLCAEIMAFNDQKHGAKVLNETPVITSLAKGCLVNLVNPSFNIITNNMTDFVSHQSLVEFCIKNNLPCDSAIIITNENASNFMKELSAERDFMTNQKLNQLIDKNLEKVTKIEGTVKHQDILGNILEGLVIKAIKSDGSQIIKKYKFPIYTVRTMVIRELIKNNGYLGLISTNIDKNEFKSYCDRWCVTELGKDFWYKFLCTVAITLKKGEHPSFYPNEEIGLHIQISDFINYEILDNRLPPELNMSIFDEYIKSYQEELDNLIKSTIIITLGPIGSGKSSISQKIAKQFEGLIHHIDGDKLDLGSIKEVMNLKNERNDYTIWQVIRHLMMSQIPIISTGGGALYSFGKNPIFLLKKRILEVLGIDVKIILLLPTSEIINFELYDKSKHDIEAIYNKDEESIAKATLNRIKSGEWDVPEYFFPSSKKSDLSLKEMKKNPNILKSAAINFSKKIISSSKKNFIFAQDLMTISDKIIMYPRYQPDNYADSESLDLDYKFIENELVIPTDIPEIGNFQQHRILAKKSDRTYHHLTISFNIDRDIKLSLNDFDDINSRLTTNKYYTGILVKLSGTVITGKNVLIKPVEFIIVSGLDDLILDGGAHLTVNSSSHSPSKMRNLTLAIKRNDLTLDLKTNSDQIVRYDLKNREESQVQIELISNFGI